MSELFFSNQLRGWQVVIGGLTACSNDACCSGGLTLPTQVNKAIKRIKKLRSDLEKSQVACQKKEEFLTEIDSLLERASELPTDPNKPCQKQSGLCTIGPGCLAVASLNLINEVTEPALEPALAPEPKSGCSSCKQ